MASQKTPEEENKFYTRLLISPQRRWGLFVVAMICGVIMASMIFGNMITGLSWVALIIPVSIVGAFLAVYPATEEWEYTPWQAQAQQYESHFRD